MGSEMVERRRFWCLTDECGHAENISIYPGNMAVRLECECCRTVYWWSRMNDKLYREYDKAEMHEQAMILLDSYPVPK